MLEAADITVRYGDRAVVENVSLSVRAGQWLMLAGPNGAGKSTLVNALTGGVPHEGRVCLNGQDTRRLRPAQLARQVGVLAQKHAFGFEDTVEEAVRLGRYAYRTNWLSGADEVGEEKVEEALRLTGLTALRVQSVRRLSGGEAQRTFLAQVLAQDPPLLVLDEPANHLDPPYQLQLFELLGQWVQKPGRALISVVHDISLARRYGTHALLLREGRSVAFGPVEEALSPTRLQEAYGMDVAAWLRETLSLWA